MSLSPGLDPASMQDLYKTLRYLNEREGMAIIMVTHDIENALREAQAHPLRRPRGLLLWHGG